MNDTTQTTAALNHGRRLTLDRSNEDGTEVLTIAQSDGLVELEVLLTERGPLVRVRAHELQIQTSGAIGVDCERFDLKASEGITLRTDGDLVQDAAGDLSCRASGALQLDGKALRLRARRGQARIEAHDDVRIDGERILLNS